MTRSERFKAWVWRMCHALSPKLEHQLRSRFSKSYWANWGERTRQVVACPDNQFIPRVPEAGRIIDGAQIMHNGLKVRCGSYYGKGPVGLLQKNRGVHEPQEERVFQEVLKHVRAGAVILELGAYWSFYSMWFCSMVPGARAFMVEPSSENLAFGKDNFSLNGLRGHFTHGWVGASSGLAPDGVPTICVDDFMMAQNLTRLAILHSDIQSAELEMLRGATRTLDRRAVDFTFISTHSEELHAACDVLLKKHGYLLVASVSPCQSYSIDGILVHRAPEAPKPPDFVLSRRAAT